MSNIAPILLKLLKNDTINLPAGFTQVAYLENAVAGQGVYTDCYNIDNKTIEIKAQPKSTQDYLFGQVPYVGGKRYIQTMSWDGGTGMYCIGACSSNMTVLYIQPALNFFIGSPRAYKFNTTLNTLTVDNIDGTIRSFTQTNKFNDLPFALMGVTYVNTNLSYYMSSSVGVRCYYCKISNNNDKTLYHYIPAVDTLGVPCMYDIVNKTTHYNEGEGNFIVGIDTKDQIKKLLRNLPDNAPQKTLQIRIGDIDDIDGIYNEINDVGLAKNWEITIA